MLLGKPRVSPMDNVIFFIEAWICGLEKITEPKVTITQAAVSAAQVRLRPILMTSLTMIFGMLPMMFASGVGANGNISIGVGTVGGMLIGTVALLFIVPVLFIVFQYLQEKQMPARKPAELENL